MRLRDRNNVACDVGLMAFDDFLLPCVAHTPRKKDCYMNIVLEISSQEKLGMTLDDSTIQKGAEYYCYRWREYSAGEQVF